MANIYEIKHPLNALKTTVIHRTPETNALKTAAIHRTPETKIVGARAAPHQHVSNSFPTQCQWSRCFINPQLCVISSNQYSRIPTTQRRILIDGLSAVCLEKLIRCISR